MTLKNSATCEALTSKLVIVLKKRSLFFLSERKWFNPITGLDVFYFSRRKTDICRQSCFSRFNHTAESKQKKTLLKQLVTL